MKIVTLDARKGSNLEKVLFTMESLGLIHFQRKNENTLLLLVPSYEESPGKASINKFLFYGPNEAASFFYHDTKVSFFLEISYNNNRLYKIHIIK